MTIIQWVISS